MVKRSRIDLRCWPSRQAQGCAGSGPDVLALRADAGGRGSKFNVRRDLNGLHLAGRHLVWPAPALMRLREFGRRCRTNEFWRGHEALATRDFLERHGTGAARMKKARCSSTWTNTPRTSPRT